ncbi:MAG: ring-cleaving dioxygenase [Ferruginibacter sp.]|nr:ring-cleaving dioxygenase [Ferruginibacter sp.]
MNNKIAGLHHITAIAGNAKRNYDFYTGVLGLRMVKKTVNFDDPGTYHFYFGNETGAPGTILTFFPWEGIGTGRIGTGMASEIGYAVPIGSLGFWAERFQQLGVQHETNIERFGEKLLSFTDPDGLKINLIEPLQDDQRKPWQAAGVTEKEGLKGFHSIVLTLNDIKATAEILTDVFEYRLQAQEGNRYRFITDAVENASIVDLEEAPELGRGVNAAGTNHHVAFRVANEDILMNYRAKIAARGLSITPKIDRDYFFSLYFREPGGVLFELATDNPGFATDETAEALGSSLRLPKQYEPSRAKIEAVLPKLD